jgi:predicted nucleic acid-binding protein
VISLDTNVVVRFLVNDDPEQNRRARKLIDAGNVRISPTVLLEAEWVLRALYRQEPDAIHASYCGLLGLPGVIADDPQRVARALEWYGSGLDFADALHLAFASGGGAFATFDAKLARRARKLDGAPRVLSP